MNRCFSRLVLVAVVGLGAVAASAQISGPVYVPFVFTANHYLLPGGAYKVERLSGSFVALIDNETGNTRGIVLAPSRAGNTHRICWTPGICQLWQHLCSQRGAHDGLQHA